MLPAAFCHFLRTFVCYFVPQEFLIANFADEIIARAKVSVVSQEHLYNENNLAR